MGVATRLDLTLRLVQGPARVSVAELAQRLGVSEMTVRRDLDALERQGLVPRVHGGAVATRAREEEAGFAAREGWQTATKDRLGAAVAERVPPGSRVLLDAGTTTVHVAEHLAARAPLTVAVLSLQAAMRLADRPGIELLLVGRRRALEPRAAGDLRPRRRRHHPALRPRARNGAADPSAPAPRLRQRPPGRHPAGERGRPAGRGDSKGEDITTVELPFGTALAMVRDGAIADARTIMLLQWAALDGPFRG
jgi:hypothetical protein